MHQTHAIAQQRAIILRRDLPMKIDASRFLVPPNGRPTLHDRPTKVEPFYKSKEGYQQILAKHVERLSELQDMLYACKEHALLVIFQGMDTAGKDGTIGHVFSGVNPEGV